jgi:hypothetical protein
VSLGQVTGFDTEHSASTPYEFTPATATVVGSGANSRVVRQLNWAAVDNGTERHIVDQGEIVVMLERDCWDRTWVPSPDFKKLFALPEGAKLLTINKKKT